MNRHETLCKISLNEWRIGAFNLSGDEERELKNEIKELIQHLAIMKGRG